mgnify:CR=1 FL=1
MLTSVLPISNSQLISEAQDDDPFAWDNNYTLFRYITSSLNLTEKQSIHYDAERDSGQGYYEWTDRALKSIERTLMTLTGLVGFYLDGLHADLLIVEFDKNDAAIMSIENQEVQHQIMSRNQFISSFIDMLATGDPKTVGKLFMSDVVARRINFELLAITTFDLY